MDMPGGLPIEGPVGGGTAGQPQTEPFQQVGSPAGEQPPNTTNLRPNHVYQGHNQPSVKTRLEHVKNFLADEDYYRCLDFIGRLEEIDEYVKWLEETKQDYDESELRQIQDMIAVHKVWIKDATTATPLDLSWSKTRLKPPNRLLPWEDIVKYQQRYRDTTASLKRSGRMKETALTIPLTASKRGPDVDPFRITKKVSEIHRKEDALMATFQAQEATLFAHNKAYIPAPPNFSGPYIPIKKVLVGNGYAKQLESLTSVLYKLIHAHDNAPRSFLAALILEVQKGICYEPNTPEESTELEVQLQGANHEQSVDVIGKWLDIQRAKDHRNAALSLAQGQLISDDEIALLLTLTEKSRSSQQGALTFESLGVWESPESALAGSYSSMLRFATHVEQLLASDIFPRLDTAVDLTILLKNVNGLSEDEALLRHRDLPAIVQPTTDQAVLYLKRMHVAGLVRWDSIAQKVQKPIPDLHPEHRYLPGANNDTPLPIEIDENGGLGPPVQRDFSYFLNLAHRLGQEMLRLVIWIATEEHPHGEQAPAAEKLKDFINRSDSERITAPELIEIAGATDDEDLAAALQTALLDEINKNGDFRTPDFEKLWTFSKSQPQDKGYFSLDRWPTKATKSGSSRGRTGLKRAAPASDDLHEADYEDMQWEKQRENELAQIREERQKAHIDDANERYYRGETAYPFGETAIQQAWLSQQLDEDLKDVEGFAHIYKGKKPAAAPSTVEELYRLPELPVDWKASDFFAAAGVAAPDAATRAGGPANPLPVHASRTVHASRSVTPEASGVTRTAAPAAGGAEAGPSKPAKRAKK